MLCKLFKLVCPCLILMLPTSCFHRPLLTATVKGLVQPNNSVQFLLLQVQGVCCDIYPVIFASLLFSIAPITTSPLPVSLQRACDSCKILYQGVDLQRSAPSSLPLCFAPSTLFWSVTAPPSPPSQLRLPALHCNVAICSCGADNSLFYLSLSSTKGPGHWSNASRLMAAQQAAFYARDTA